MTNKTKVWGPPCPDCNAEFDMQDERWDMVDGRWQHDCNPHTWRIYHERQLKINFHDAVDRVSIQAVKDESDLNLAYNAAMQGVLERYNRMLEIGKKTCSECGGSGLTEYPAIGLDGESLISLGKCETCNGTGEATQ